MNKEKFINKLNEELEELKGKELLYFNMRDSVQEARCTNRIFGIQYALNCARLLDEPQKVKVPSFIGRWIEEVKQRGCGLADALNCFASPIMAEDVKEWLDFNFSAIGCHHDHQELLARAWLDGYEVEEEPKYTVAFEGKGDQLNYRIALFGFNSHGKPCIGFSKRSNLTPVCKDEMLTELEIKSYDERLWTFAEQVEKV